MKKLLNIITIIMLLNTSLLFQLSPNTYQPSIDKVEGKYLYIIWYYPTLPIETQGNVYIGEDGNTYELLLSYYNSCGNKCETWRTKIPRCGNYTVLMGQIGSKYIYGVPYSFNIPCYNNMIYTPIIFN